MLRIVNMLGVTSVSFVPASVSRHFPVVERWRNLCLNVFGVFGAPLLANFPSPCFHCLQLEERERISREHNKFLEERGATAKLAYEMADDRSKHKQWAEKLAYLKGRRCGSWICDCLSLPPSHRPVHVTPVTPV